jgi:glycosyltransferase involved in cell wall biosynthesis
LALVKNRIFSGLAEKVLRDRGSEYDAVLVNGATVRDAVHHVNAVHFVHDAWLKSPFHIAKLNPGPYGYYQWLYTALNRRWEAKAFAAAESVVAVSNQVREELIVAGVPPDDVRVIHNGVDLSDFSPGPAVRSAYELPEEPVIALFAGDIRTPRKNLDTVLRALVEVPALHLAVAGAVDKSPFPAMANRLKIQDRVHFLGFERRMNGLMRSVDFFVFPSRYEACTLVLLEAMGAGLPVITANTTGGAELVTEEAGTVLSNPEDTVALAEAMRTMMRDPVRRRQMGLAAHKVAERYTFARTAKAYADLLEEVSDK